jgi:GNAT superfamily N-acetyltransferase
VVPARSADDVRIETYSGSRVNLRPLFELAEDSAAELDSYIESGRVLAAVSGGEVIGHLQLTGTGDPRQAEIKNMAVREDRQGHGVGRRLIQAAVDLAAAESVTTIVVATAAADVGNLRFYQRQGFRMRSVERDAFTPATGYPPGLLIDGIELRDRVWLDRAVLASSVLLLLGSPPAVEVGELVSHLRSQVLGFEPAGQADRLAHLGQVLGAVRAGRQVRLETAPGPGAQRPLKVVGDQVSRPRSAASQVSWTTSSATARLGTNEAASRSICSW